MELVALVGLALGFFTLALWQKKVWIMIGAAITFVALGAYGLAEGSPGEALWIMGTFSLIFAFTIFLYATFRMKEGFEPPSLPEEPDEAYARELKEASNERRKERANWKGQRRSRF